MAVTITHAFVSAIPDGDDTSLVRPSNWNDEHTVTGLGTAAEADTTDFAAAVHTHAISDVTGLQTALDSKAASVHTHVVADLSDASANGRSLISAANYAAMVTLLAITVGGITDMSANARTFNQAADYPAMRTALGVAIGSDVQAYDADLASWAGVTRASGFDTFAATPSSANLRALLTDEVGTGAAYFVGGALGTPASATLTNATGLPVSTGISGLGTGVATALAVNVGSAGAFVTFNGALGTPSSGTLTNATGLPISTGVSGLASGVATFLATPSSANLRAMLTDESGTGVALFQGSKLTQADSGFWYADAGATKNDFERVFIGAARAYDANTSPNNGDYISTFQVAQSKSPYAALAQTYIAGDASSAEAIISLMVGQQSSGRTSFAIGTFEKVVNNETGSDVHTFGGAVEAHRLASAGVTIGREFQIINHGSNVSSGPYGIVTATGRNIAITVGSGASHAGMTSATAAMVIFQDTSTFNAGIIFGNGAIATTGADSLAKAAMFATDQALAWHTTSDVITGTLRVNSSSQFVIGTATAIIPNANDGVSLGVSGTAFSDLFLASGAVVNFSAGDVTITHSSNALAFAGATTNGYSFADGPIKPAANDGAALGVSGTAWSDLFLASGAVVNFNAGDVTITHSADALAFAGATNGYTFDAGISITSTDAGAGGGPSFVAIRDSASPAAGDDIGSVVFYGKDSGGNLTLYAAFAPKILDPTNGSEDSQLNFLTSVAGSATVPFAAAAGLMVGSASDPGAGHLAIQYGIATGVPVTKTGTSSTIASTETSVIFNASGTHTVTLPAASSFSGRWLYLKTRAAQAVNSASSNVKPLGTDTAGTAILTANAGRWAFLQSDGTNWVIMAGVV